MIRFRPKIINEPVRAVPVNEREFGAGKARWFNPVKIKIVGKMVQNLLIFLADNRKEAVA